MNSYDLVSRSEFGRRMYACRAASVRVCLSVVVSTVCTNESQIRMGISGFDYLCSHGCLHSLYLRSFIMSV